MFCACTNSCAQCILLVLEVMSACCWFGRTIPSACVIGAAIKWECVHCKDEHPGARMEGLLHPGRYAWAFLRCSRCILLLVVSIRVSNNNLMHCVLRWHSQAQWVRCLSSLPRWTSFPTHCHSPIALEVVAWVHWCSCTCTYVYMYICMYVCMYVCVHIIMYYNVLCSSKV